MTGQAPTPHIRSFGTRKGHLSSGQRTALDELRPLHGLAFQRSPIDLASVFGNDHPVILEIGCGMGETSAAIAQANPHLNYLGVEVYPAGVGSLLRRIESMGLRNLRVVSHDAVEVLQVMIGPDTLAGAHIYFPDPWPKKRHHKRRLIQPPFVELLSGRLAPGGYLHCATDWMPYAEQMLEVLQACPALRNRAQGYHPRPDSRPLTKFEARGLRLGHEVRDLVFERR